MKRRTFLKALGAALVAPVVTLKALAKPKSIPLHVMLGGFDSDGVPYKPKDQARMFVYRTQEAIDDDLYGVTRTVRDTTEGRKSTGLEIWQQ